MGATMKARKTSFLLFSCPHKSKALYIDRHRRIIKGKSWRTLKIWKARIRFRTTGSRMTTISDPCTQHQPQVSKSTQVKRFAHNEIPLYLKWPIWKMSWIYRKLKLPLPLSPGRAWCVRLLSCHHTNFSPLPLMQKIVTICTWSVEARNAVFELSHQQGFLTATA